MIKVQWNKKDIRELVEMLNAVELGPGQRVGDVVDMSDLPTCPIPDGAETYPIWAMDEQGYCLVGQAADAIEHIKDIMLS